MDIIKTAIILAGGKSKRMGFDKINIPYKNGYLLNYQIETLKEVFDEIIVVSNNLKNYDDKNIKVVSDEYTEIGPLAGLHVGLKHASSLFCYVIACDMPNISVSYINEMRSILSNNKDVHVLFSEVNGYFEPFNAFYNRKLYKGIEEYISNTDTSIRRKNHFSIQSFVKSFKTMKMENKSLEEYNNDLFKNLNTMEDLKNNKH